MPIDTVRTLRDLVRIPSVNPMGRPVEGDIYGEHRLTDHLEQLVGQMGLPCERYVVAKGRDNLIARLDGNDSVLMFQVHQDTVPVDGMTIDPWAAALRDGRIYGRGACDVKGGMACLLSAVSRLAEERPGNVPTIVLAFTVNEEYGFTGSAHLRELWNSGQSRLLPAPPDAIVVAEPTQLNVVVAHKGILRWRCHTQGQAAHSSDPQCGVNAIYDMARVLAALQQYDQTLISAIEPHPLVGRPSLNVGTITGGISVNTVPDRCTIEIERRLLPDEDPKAAYHQAVQYVAQQCREDLSVEHQSPDLASAGLTDQHNANLAARLAHVAGQVGVPCQSIGVSFGTDASELAVGGTATVVFGPGSIEQAHRADEWIAVDQLEKATEIIYRLMRLGIR